MAAKLLKGADVVNAMSEKVKAQVEALAAKGVTPTLAILRVGEKDADISYERGATKRCSELGVAVKKVLLPVDVSQADLLAALSDLNNDDSVHGILMFRPLPEHLDGEAIRNALSPAKDIDGITNASMGRIFTGSGDGFVPCTAQAVIEILDYYGVEIQGKNAVVIGHSLVVGRPVSTLLLGRNAHVTTGHVFSKDVPTYAKMADIIVVAVGRAGLVDAKYLAEGQIIIDVGINVNAEGKLCGDVAFDQADPVVEAITPVPGGVGTVTTNVLVSHVVEAAVRANA